MADVFVSYARSSEGQARAVAAALKGAGYSVWYDAELPTHRAYGDVIQEELERARAVIVIWSAEAIKSQWVRSEADRARGAGKLVQLTLDGTLLPMPFDQIQCADLTGAGAGSLLTHPGWAKVSASLATLLQGGGRGAGVGAPGGYRPHGAGHGGSHGGFGEPLLAVLPFDNLSNDEEMQFFSDGVSEEIIQRLSRGAQLKVIGRTSSFQFRGARKEEAALALGASHVLDGSIRRAGGRVRVAAHLVEARGGVTLWTDRYDRDLEDIFAVQDEISEQIAAALHTAFTAEAREAVSAEAYELFLRARPESDSAEGVQKTIALLELALEKAPDYADALAALADARAFHLFYEPWRGRRAKAAPIRAMAERAAALDPENPVAVRAQVYLAAPFSDYVSRSALIERMRPLRALPADTASAGDVVTAFLLSVGRVREGLGFAEGYLKLDPLNRNHANSAGFLRCAAGQYAEASEVLDPLIDRFDAGPMVWNALMARCYAGDWAALDEMLTPEWLARHPLRELSGIVSIIKVWRDPTPQNRAWLLSRVQAQAKNGLDQGTLAVASGCGLASEMHDLAEGARFGPSGGSHDRIGINAYGCELLFNAPFAAFRADPRFPALCVRLGLVEYWQASGVWPDCVDDVPYDFVAACEAAAKTVEKQAFPF